MIPSMEGWIATHWFDLIQSAGIVVALFRSFKKPREDKKARQLKNLSELIENHREVWRPYGIDPELRRIKQRDIDLEKEPVTLKEAIFVRSIITHLLGAYEATLLKEIVGLEKLGEDAGHFLSFPIPNAVWQDVKGVQESAFVQFVERELR